jgi:hypothetical protein
VYQTALQLITGTLMIQSQASAKIAEVNAHLVLYIKDAIHAYHPVMIMAFH